MNNRVDQQKLDTQFPLETPQGVAALLQNYRYVKSAALDRSDFDAINILVDFERVFDKVTLTKRQKEAIRLVYEEKLTQQEAGEVLGITQQAVGQLLQAVARKISEEYEKDYLRTKGGIKNVG
ncbi:sigma factor-like helix-turn-helix DNA-binding protein [Bacillus andreraoultii]|uniref:sigma factor-like helix-turn-helix DNA-binding protein n=1 Tax=Bacillus andreraoultii TaxID=1499685 RepID=UPI00067EAD88|nr:sigma factor-like helix-turn-helix DNA-binding protein [Bacillus andreraoultii]